MAGSPIQVVLNSSDFIQFWDRQGGGPHKDFYEGKDKEFVVHRNKIASQLTDVKIKPSQKNYSNISYAKVRLRPSALAKSHRPTSAIFNNNVSPIVGGANLGELLIELNPGTIDSLSTKILTAEEKTKYKDQKDGKKVANPSPLRSEIGAIEEIRPYGVEDKRKFSLSQAIKWLSDPRTGGIYIVELFETPIPRKDWDTLPEEKAKLFKSFTEGLMAFGNAAVLRIDGGESNSIPSISIRLEENVSQSNIQLIPSKSTSRKTKVHKPDLSEQSHKALMKFLDGHQLVRRVLLPPIIYANKAKSLTPKTNTTYRVSVFKKDTSYPKVAVVDGGVSGLFGSWIEESHGLISPADKDEYHGSFIAGLLLSGSTLNGSEICQEPDGCRIIDVDILPNDTLFDKYYTGFNDFFDELENAVRDLKARTGVRVFNFSLNVREHVTADVYSIPAQRLDQIAETQDVLFVISAGNSEPMDCRDEWPDDPTLAVQILAQSRNDNIKKPAESYRNLSVSALNPPNIKGIVGHALSNYSCRGPGLRIGLKPDLAHIGGSGTPTRDDGHGLYSTNANGIIGTDCGTSFAAPNVAKGIACLERLIEGDVSRETLIALAVHHARVPALMTVKELKTIAKDLVGFGVPNHSEEILAGSDHSITLVFANRIYAGKRMNFNFSWPAALVKNGKCRGSARLTIVSTPPFNYKFEQEVVRVNIEAHLRQMQEDGSFKGKLVSVHVPDVSSGLHEKSMIEHSFKWSPVKVFEGNFPIGVGSSTDWRLDVEYLARDGEQLPDEGIPFTAILTISDPTGEAPVFNSMRQALRSTGVNILDIKNAARVISRV